jgi:hypothetical protein
MSLTAGLLDRLRSVKRRLLRRSEGRAILLERYASVHGRQPDLTNPRRFTEKLLVRMIELNRRPNPVITRLTDKCAVREYVGARAGKELLTDLLWEGTDPGQIPFDRLPADYVIKTNHGSGRVMVVRGAADRRDVVAKLTAWLGQNHYWLLREYQYFHITPRIMVEAYLKGPDGGWPLDYRFWCFHGVPEVVQVDDHAHGINPFYDLEWNQLDLAYREGAPRPAIARPPNLDRMIEVARTLSADFDFVRVDLYDLAGTIRFGELTFTPTGGLLKLQPDRWDLELGRKWNMSAAPQPR